MVYTLSNQLYMYEHGLSAAGQRAADVRAGEAAATLRDMRRSLGCAFRLRRRVRLGRPAAGTLTAPARVLSSAR